MITLVSNYWKYGFAGAEGTTNEDTEGIEL